MPTLIGSPTGAAADIEDAGWNLAAAGRFDEAGLAVAYADVIRGYHANGATLQAHLAIAAARDWITTLERTTR